MIRARYERRGPVPQDVIYPAEFETPRLSAGQALVEVVAAPINPADLLTLTGEYGQLPPLPAIGGREGVGRVAELGQDTRDVTVGDLVLLPLGCGSWSTHVVTEAAQLTPLPTEADPFPLTSSLCSAERPQDACRPARAWMSASDAVDLCARDSVTVDPGLAPALRCSAPRRRRELSRPPTHEVSLASNAPTD
jgi:hypothetical protein